jgi:hypothetical protein
VAQPIKPGPFWTTLFWNQPVFLSLSGQQIQACLTMNYDGG